MSSDDVASSRISTAGSARNARGERDQLPLTGGQSGTLLVHVGVEAVGERRDEFVRADRAGRGFDLADGRVRPAEGDVLRDGPAEHEVLLRDDDDGAAQVGLGQVAHVDAVESHPAGRRVPEAGGEARDRRLARAGRADERHGLAGRDVEIEMRQDDPFAIAELDTVELHRTARVRQRHG